MPALERNPEISWTNDRAAGDTVSWTRTAAGVHAARRRAPQCSVPSLTHRHGDAGLSVEVFAVTLLALVDPTIAARSPSLAVGAVTPKRKSPKLISLGLFG
jgi:hypothetical protein